MKLRELMATYPNIKRIDMYCEPVGYSFSYAPDDSELDMDMVVNAYEVLGNNNEILYIGDDA